MKKDDKSDIKTIAQEFEEAWAAPTRPTVYFEDIERFGMMKYRPEQLRHLWTNKPSFGTNDLPSSEVDEGEE